MTSIDPNEPAQEVGRRPARGLGIGIAVALLVAIALVITFAHRVPRSHDAPAPAAQQQ